MWFRKNKKLLVSGRPKSKHSWIPKLFTLLAILMTLVGGFLFLTSNFFYIKQLEVKTEEVGCATVEDLKNTSQILNRNVFFIDKQVIEDKLRKKYTCIKSISLLPRFPSKIIMHVFGRIATTQLLSLSEKQSSSSAILEDFLKKDSSESAKENLEIKEKYLVDEEGVLFTKDENESLRKLYIFDDDLTLGQKLDQNIFKNFQEVIKKLDVLGISSNEAKIYSNIYLLYSSKPKLIIDLSGNIKAQLASLQLILSRAKIEEKEMEFIDTRFENPVVKYAPKKGDRR